MRKELLQILQEVRSQLQNSQPVNSVSLKMMNGNMVMVQLWRDTPLIKINWTDYQGDHAHTILGAATACPIFF